MPTDDDLTKLSALELVKLYGAWNHDAGTVRADGGGALYRQRIAGANDLLAEIERRLEQQPVQARDDEGIPWELHAGCGNAFTTGKALHQAQCNKPGPWRPLLVVAADSPPPAADRAPEDDRVSTMREQRMQELAAAETTLRQVMEALGVDRPEDVLRQIKADRILRDMLILERDEARAESEKRLDALIKTRAERDAWIEQARQVGAKLEAFKAAAPVHDGVLRLPEVPEGTVALTGTDRETGGPGMLFTPGPHRGEWLDYQGVAWQYHEVLVQHEPLTVELAPPPAPAPRTAAEIWAGLPAGTGESLREWDENLAELAEALDREMGRTS